MSNVTLGEPPSCRSGTTATYPKSANSNPPPTEVCFGAKLSGGSSPIYYGPSRDEVRRLEADHLGGQRHVHESRMKERRGTHRDPAHASRPSSAIVAAVDLNWDR